MKHNTKHLTDERGQINDEMQRLGKIVSEEKREWTTEEEAKFDELAAKDTTLEKRIADLDGLNKNQAKAVENTEEIAERSNLDVGQIEDQKKAYNDAYANFLRGGNAGLKADEKSLLVDAARAQTVTTTGGGYLIPTDLSNEIIVSLLSFGGMREVSRILPTGSGNNIDFPTDDDTGNKGVLIAINTKASEQDLTFGTKQLNAYKFSSNSIRVPNELIQDSAFDIQAHVTEQLGIRLARATNEYYTGTGGFGTGSSQPQGIINGATQGKLSAASTTTTFSELLDLKSSVDPAYRANATWMMNDNSLNVIKKLSMTTANQSIWQAGIIGSAPATIDGQRYTINQDLDDMADNTRSWLYGDFSKFIIRDVAGMAIKRSDEVYMETDQVVFVGFMRTDSRLMNTEAVKYMRQIVT
jgi:HK97 family phage major capsid protein|tara:strand:- start:4237 stop:5472 length:1236 start_codon:yes stop_codon:yes gene_type:complete